MVELVTQILVALNDFNVQIKKTQLVCNVIIIQISTKTHPLSSETIITELYEDEIGQQLKDDDDFGTISVEEYTESEPIDSENNDDSNLLSILLPILTVVCFCVVCVLCCCSQHRALWRAKKPIFDKQTATLAEIVNEPPDNLNRVQSVSCQSTKSDQHQTPKADDEIIETQGNTDDGYGNDQNDLDLPGDKEQKRDSLSNIAQIPLPQKHETSRSSNYSDDDNIYANPGGVNKKQTRREKFIEEKDYESEHKEQQIEMQKKAVMIVVSDENEGVIAIHDEVTEGGMETKY